MHAQQGPIGAPSRCRSTQRRPTAPSDVACLLVESTMQVLGSGAVLGVTSFGLSAHGGKKEVFNNELLRIPTLAPVQFGDRALQVVLTRSPLPQCASL